MGAAMCATTTVAAAITVSTSPNESTLTCSVGQMVTLQPATSLANPNPIDSMMVMPARCSGVYRNMSDAREGIKGLLMMGYSVQHVSHQVTPLRTKANGEVDLLLSAVFILAASPDFAKQTGRGGPR
jgi:hypothetical protein